MDDLKFLRYAIEISKKATGGKNFRVGSIIVKRNKIIAEGYSWENGIGTHAEENALNKLEIKEVEGSTVYCSMAPCTSRSSGKESCLDRLIRYKVNRVVYATLAPDERDILPKGLELIQIKELELEARKVNPHLSWAN